MDSLYKYTRLEFVNSTLNNGIFASHIPNLNDPYEYKDTRIENGNFRVVCMTKSRNKKLMWSHYADGHRGCSIKIKPPDNYGTDDCILKPVQYIGKIPKADDFSDDYFKLLYTKDKKWDYEHEVRAVYRSGQDDKYWKKYRKNIFFKAEILQIDFGCSAQNDLHYLDALIAIRDYNANHTKQITVRKYKMANDKYLFILDKSFNYIEEIETLLKQVKE